MRRSLRNVAILVSVLGIGTFVSLASADPKTEAEAKKLQSAAMDEDFLSLDLKAAQKKLEEAVKKCGGGKCSEAVVAGLQRDLGIVLINNKKVKEGQKAFEAAFAADAAVTIGKDFLGNADVSKAWEAAKKSAAGKPAPTATAEPTATAVPTATATAKPPTGGNAEGNIEVKSKQAPTSYPMPVVIDLPEGLDVESVKFSYKTTAMEKYKTLEAKKDSGKYVVTIGCEDTQFVGDIKFYVRAYDADKNEVEHFGTLKKPGVIKLVDKLPDDVEAPSYPGGKEPEKCVEKGDCQPGFPCDKSSSKKPQGSGCEADDECDAGLACVENENGKKWCYESGAPSSGGGKGKAGGKNFFLGADLGIETMLVPSSNDLCNDPGPWVCSKNGTDIGGVKDGDKSTALAPGGGGRTGGGLSLATMRVMLAGDYFLGATKNLSIGGRLGYAFYGGNTRNVAAEKFMPYHAEVRAQYFFGPPKTKGVRLYGMFSGGVAEFDAKVSKVTAVPAAPERADNSQGCVDAVTAVANATTDEARAAAESDRQRTCRISSIDGYRRTGIQFVSLGGGAWIYASESLAVNAGVKFMIPFPTFSPVIGFEIGGRFGL